MSCINDFLQKQCCYLLQNEFYALFFVAVLAFIPFCAWLSLAIIFLITLRKGSYNGLKLLITGLTVAIITDSRDVGLPYAIPSVFLTYMTGYLAALALRASISWKTVGGIVLAIALFFILIIQILMPSYVMEQFQALSVIFKSLDQSSQMIQLLDGKHGQSQKLLADYLLGVKVFSIMLSALSSLILARYIQSLLYYPGGLRKEILAFRASQGAVVLLLLSVAGTYQNYSIAISTLPILVFYFMVAGMILLFDMMHRKKDWVALFCLFTPLIMAPYIVLPLYVLFGSLDSLFNFRLRLLSKRK